jgi:hypothetical protein
MNQRAKSWHTVWIAACVLASSNCGWAAIIGPYVADSDTLHLYHFDESATPLEDNGFVDANDIDLTALNGAPALSASAYAGFGSSVGFAAATNDAVGATSVSQSSLQGGNGAFTYEAMVRLTDIGGDEQQIVAHGNSGGNQSFQFRISGGVLQLISVQPAVVVLGANIPTTGPEAFEPNEWFHVAGTYDGTSTANLYWTRVDPSRTAATLLGSGVFGDISSTGIYDFAVGSRNPFGGVTIHGQIDEVRISAVARSADEFIFAAVPEPTAVGLVVVACFAMASIRTARNTHRSV